MITVCTYKRLNTVIAISSRVSRRFYARRAITSIIMKKCFCNDDNAPYSLITTSIQTAEITCVGGDAFSRNFYLVDDNHTLKKNTLLYPSIGVINYIRVRTFRVLCIKNWRALTFCATFSEFKNRLHGSVQERGGAAAGQRVRWRQSTRHLLQRYARAAAAW